MNTSSKDAGGLANVHRVLDGDLSTWHQGFERIVMAACAGVRACVCACVRAFLRACVRVSLPLSSFHAMRAAT